MSVRVLPMMEPALLKDIMDVLGPPDRVYLTGDYQDTDIRSMIAADEGFDHGDIHISQEISLESGELSVDRILSLYKRDYEEFQEMFKPGAAALNRAPHVSIRELVWLKYDTVKGAVQADREHYYLTFDKYRLEGRIDPAVEPRLTSELIALSKAHGLKIPIRIG